MNCKRTVARSYSTHRGITLNSYTRARIINGHDCNISPDKALNHWLNFHKDLRPATLAVRRPKK
jgi:hypothetical protein